MFGSVPVCAVVGGWTVQIHVPRTSHVTSVPVGAQSTTRLGNVTVRVTVIGITFGPGDTVMLSSRLTWIETSARPSWSGIGSRSRISLQVTFVISQLVTVAIGPNPATKKQRSSVSS
ncbi:MAG TPA: hypothetical protein VNT01_03725 [Symbiobacteriaceae bacterium]|nr:hypothetical protein [Symbiobacteriaceae bacterium]